MNNEELTDASPMPWGKYKGEKMEDVPASYLHYLWTNGLDKQKDNQVAVYIRGSLASLEKEYPNGIWR